jgi:hypothetical protein
MAGQAAALPVLAAAGAWGDPWIVSAVFGMAAAIASWAGARIAGNFREATGSASRVPPQDLALYDAFTLALIVAASADLGLGAALLLPAGAVLALAIRKTRCSCSWWQSPWLGCAGRWAFGNVLPRAWRWRLLP